MSDLSIILGTAIGKLLDSGKVEEIIQAKINKTFAESIDEALRSYSDFGKQLSEKIKEALTFDPSRISVQEYNQMVTHIIERKLHDYMEKQAAEGIGKAMEEILKPAPPTMKLSELIEEFKRDAAEWHGHERENPHISVHVEPESRYGSRWISLDRGPDKDKHSCEFRFLICEDGRISALRFSGHDPKKSVFMGGYYGFERDLFRLHSGRTRITVDATTFDTEVEIEDGD